MPPEERRAAIIAAVRPLLIEHGDRITIRQIADAAGIAEGTIFRVFTDKDALIIAAVDAALDPGSFEQAISSIDPESSLTDQLIAVTEVTQRRVDDIWRLVSNLRPDLRARMNRPLTTSPALVELLARHRSHLRVEPARAAQLLRALTLSMTHPMLAGDPAPAHDIVDVVLHGITREEPSAT